MGVDTENDPFIASKAFVPPPKTGLCLLLHLVKSLKSTGKAVIIMPLGVLFRGNAEAGSAKPPPAGYIKGIIGLPPNLFYGTGIAACIIIIDKENAAGRKGVFLIDASRGYAKDGKKPPARAGHPQDRGRLQKQMEWIKYSRLVPLAEIADPKTTTTSTSPLYRQPGGGRHSGHRRPPAGRHSDRDVAALNALLKVYPSLGSDLFRFQRTGRLLGPEGEKDDIRHCIFEHPISLPSPGNGNGIRTLENRNAAFLKSLEAECHPK